MASHKGGRAVPTPRKSVVSTKVSRVAGANVPPNSTGKAGRSDGPPPKP
jgi:hypothetical protein